MIAIARAFIELQSTLGADVINHREFCLRYTFNLTKEADNLEKAVATVLDKGIRNGDVMAKGAHQVATVELGEAILTEFKAL